MNATHFKLHQARLALRTTKKRVKGKLVADINVTPLVDVVLVLLIIFMVVTPMIVRGVQVDLPRTVNHGRKPDNGKDIIVSVTKDKDVYITSTKVTVKELPRLIEDEKRRFPDKTVYVKADTRTSYGIVREVMEAIHKTGFDDVTLGTEEIKPGAQAPN